MSIKVNYDFAVIQSRMATKVYFLDKEGKETNDRDNAVEVGAEASIHGLGLVATAGVPYDNARDDHQKRMSAAEKLACTNFKKDFLDRLTLD